MKKSSGFFTLAFLLVILGFLLLAVNPSSPESEEHTRWDSVVPDGGASQSNDRIGVQHEVKVANTQSRPNGDPSIDNVNVNNDIGSSEQEDDIEMRMMRRYPKEKTIDYHTAIKELFESKQNGNPEQVGVGVFILNLSDENLSEGSFYCDVLIYFVKNPNPDFSNPICNGLKLTDSNNGKYRPVLVNGGRWPVMFNLTHSYRIMTRFYFRLNAAPWPYDTQTYDVVVELEDLPLQRAVFCHMEDYTGLADTVRFAGRETEEFKVVSRLDVRDSPPFTVIGNNGTLVSLSRFSRFTINVISTRPYLKSFIKTMLPPTFFCFVVLYTYLLPHSEAVTRISVLGSILISSVMFHVGLESGLPLSSTLNRADAFMICIYIIILCPFLLAMLLLRLQTGGNNKLSQRISDYAELPGIVGTPLIFVGLAFDDNYFWVIFAIVILIILCLMFITFLYRKFFKEKIYKIMGKAVTDVQTEQVENVDKQTGWVTMKGAKDNNAFNLPEVPMMIADHEFEMETQDKDTPKESEDEEDNSRTFINLGKYVRQHRNLPSKRKLDAGVPTNVNDNDDNDDDNGGDGNENEDAGNDEDQNDGHSDSIIRADTLPRIPISRTSNSKQSKNLETYKFPPSSPANKEGRKLPIHLAEKPIKYVVRKFSESLQGSSTDDENTSPLLLSDEEDKAKSKDK